MHNTMELEQQKIGKLLLKFSIPAIVGMLTNALYNIVDRIFIGKGVGSMAFSGLTATFPIMTIIMAFAMLIGIGGSALISIRLGQKKKEEAEQILGNAFILICIVSAFVSILGLLFLEPVLLIFGASKATLPYAKQYMTIILAGTIFQNIGFGLNHIIRAEGNPKRAMSTMLLGAILNIILDSLFIFVFHLGIQGAAYATLLSQAASAAWVLSYFLKGKSTLKLSIKNFYLKKQFVLGIFAIGMSPFFMQLSASAVNALINNGLQTYGGDLALGAMGGIMSISMLFLMPIFGINQGAQPIIGYNYGAQQYHRVKEALKLAILSATGITLIGFVAIQLFPFGFMRMFTQDEVMIQIGARGIRIYLFMLPIIGFQIISSNYFQAIGKAVVSMFLSLLRQVILLIPLLLLLPRFWGIDGVWVAGPISDFGSAAITAAVLFWELRRLHQKHEQSILKESVA